MITAVQCVREIFPNSSVRTVRRDNPLTLTITAVIMEGQSKRERHEIWVGKQQMLFLKNPKKRRKTIDIIKSRLSDLQYGIITSMKKEDEKNYKKEENTRTLSVMPIRPQHGGVLPSTTEKLPVMVEA